jgi:hypothetical protein
MKNEVKTVFFEAFLALKTVFFGVFEGISVPEIV